MRFVVGADHRGYQLKDAIAAYLRAQSHEVLDTGVDNGDSVDYPDIAANVGRAIQDGRGERGVLVCGSGVGACIAANKMAGVRAGLTHDTYSAHQGVEHDDMNVICIGSRIIGEELALEIVRAFATAQFVPEERYVRRLRKVQTLENARLPAGQAGEQVRG